MIACWSRRQAIAAINSIARSHLVRPFQSQSRPQVQLWKLDPKNDREVPGGSLVQRYWT